MRYENFVLLFGIGINLYSLPPPLISSMKALLNSHIIIIIYKSHRTNQ